MGDKSYISKCVSEWAGSQINEPKSGPHNIVVIMFSFISKCYFRDWFAYRDFVIDSMLGKSCSAMGIVQWTFSNRDKRII
jgi:hypothetical protein